MRIISPVASCLLAFTALITCPSIGEGFQQLLQEVFQTELVYPQEKGEVQLMLEPRFQKSESRKLWELPLGVEYGLTDAWQVGTEWVAYQSRKPVAEDTVSGGGDLEVGTKYSFMNMGGSNTHAALGFGVMFPLGDIDKDLTEGFIQYTPSLMLAHDFLRWGGLHIFTQASVSYLSREKSHTDPEENEPQAHEYSWSSGFFLPWKDWRLTTELHWTTNRWNHDGNDAELYVTPGTVYRFTDDWEAGVALALGLNDHADDYQVLSSVVYEFQPFARHAP